MATAALPPLPRYNGPDASLRDWSDKLCTTIEIWSRSLQAPAGEPWIVNGTTNGRDVDPAVVTTIAEVVNVLGALVTDLARGVPLAVT